MMDKETEKLLKSIDTKTQAEEVQFLKYLIDCCENVLEDPKAVTPLAIFKSPIAMQMVKMRAEVTQRLEQVYGIKYGKFATRTHLMANW